MEPISRTEIRAILDHVHSETVHGHTPRVSLTDEQVNYLAHLAHDGDAESLEVICLWGTKLIAPHLKSMNWVRYPTSGPDDMWQEGRLMLLKSIEKFKGERGYNFGAYAARVIANHLGEWAERNSLTISVPRHARRRLRREGEVDETTLAARAAGSLPKYLSTALMSTAASAGQSEAAIPGVNTQASDERLAEDDVESDVLRRELQGRMRAALARLDPLHCEVVRCRFVCELSVEKTSKLLHVGMGTVRALETEALALLGQTLEDYRTC